MIALRWERGFPPGDYYAGMTDDFDVYFSPGGQVWHRRRSEQETAAMRARRVDAPPISHGDTK